MAVMATQALGSATTSKALCFTSTAIARARAAARAWPQRPPRSGACQRPSSQRARQQLATNGMSRVKSTLRWVRAGVRATRVAQSKPKPGFSNWRPQQATTKSSKACQRASAQLAWSGLSPARAITVPLTSDARGGILGERSNRDAQPCQWPPATRPRARPWSTALLR